MLIGPMQTKLELKENVDQNIKLDRVAAEAETNLNNKTAISN
jgi:hypothetical protein